MCSVALVSALSLTGLFFIALGIGMMSLLLLLG